MRQSRKVFLILFILIFSGCNGYKAKDPSLDLGQNWGRDDQKAFYQTSQGSQIIKYAWFFALERPDTEEKFFSDKLDRFGYLPDLPELLSDSEYNPDALPIGFVKDVDEDKEQWIGMTCAACHTNQMIIGGQPHHIDGAPTNADFYKFIKELSLALSKTASDPVKRNRFIDAVKAQSERLKLDFAGVDELKKDLSKEAENFRQFVFRSSPVKGNNNPPNKRQWGKARLDAFALIINELADTLNRDDSNVKAADAPVSYPFIWDTHQQARVQWNGVSSGSLSRNTTEVLGVFARFEPENPTDNSVKLGNLRKLEKLVTQLRSPKWAKKEFNLPPIDKTRIEGVGRGKELYKVHCQNCHKVFDRNADQADDVTIVLNPINENIFKNDPSNMRNIGDERAIDTDETMAMNFYDREITVEKDGKPRGVVDALGSLLPKIWFKSISKLIVGAFQALIGEKAKEFRVYKARPLNGVWATAPYLHNGSVPNMMELLKPPNERAATFCVGSQVFDPENMGFESKLNAKENECGNDFWFDTSQPGNSNQGHDYNNNVFSEQQRKDIIEFIKSE